MAKKEVTQMRKIDMVPRKYVIITNNWDTINKNFPKNINKLIRHIAQYRHRNLSKLNTLYPMSYPPWTPDNNTILYDVTGIDPDKFKEDVLTIRGNDDYVDPYLADKTTNVLLNLLVRWCIEKKKKKELEILTYYVGYSYYWGNYYKYFNNYKLSLPIMTRTIDELSYKSLLKSSGTVDRWIYVSTESTFESYKEKLKDGSDYDLYYIGEKIRDKFNESIKYIFNEYDNNSKEGIGTHISSDMIGENIVETNNGVAEIVTLADKYTSKFFSDPVNEVAIKGAKSEGSITEKDLRNTIFNIADNRTNVTDVRTFYQSLFFIFLNNSKYTVRDVGTARFYFEMQKLYKPGNTHDTNRIAIRDLMDKWLTIGSKTFKNTNRDNTISKFRKSIYDYFILKIMQDS